MFLLHDILTKPLCSKTSFFKRRNLLRYELGILLGDAAILPIQVNPAVTDKLKNVNYMSCVEDKMIPENHCNCTMPVSVRKLLMPKWVGSAGEKMENFDPLVVFIFDQITTQTQQMYTFWEEVWVDKQWRIQDFP